MSAIYYECHVTVRLEPDLLDQESRKRQLSELGRSLGFKLAELTTNKWETEVARPQKSWILTGHSKLRDQLLDRMKEVALALKSQGFAVERYKIEDITLDSRVADSYGLLG